jgi:hypothetical protein
MYGTYAIEICSAAITAALCPGNAQEHEACCCYRIAVRARNTIEFQYLSPTHPEMFLVFGSLGTFCFPMASLSGREARQDVYEVRDRQ